MRSQGYRKVAGDVCSGGVEADFEAVACSSTGKICLFHRKHTLYFLFHPGAVGKQTVVIVLAILLVVAVCVAVSFGALFFW